MTKEKVISLTEDERGTLYDAIQTQMDELQFQIWEIENDENADAEELKRRDILSDDIKTLIIIESKLF